MDWTPLETALIGAAATVISASSAVVAGYVRSRVRNEAAADAIVRVETLAAGIAHDALTTAVANGAPDWAAAKRQAIAQGVAGAQALLGTAPSAMAVAAALAPLLAVDPSAPAGSASSATATSVGAEAVAVAAPAGPVATLVNP